MIHTNAGPTLIFAGGKEPQSVTIHNQGPAVSKILLGGTVGASDYTLRLGAGYSWTFRKHRGPITAMFETSTPSRLMCIATTHDGFVENP